MNDLIDRKIVDFRPMTAEEIATEGWGDTNEIAVVLVLDDGQLLYPSRDPEGNGPGALFGQDPSGVLVCHMAKEEWS